MYVCVCVFFPFILDVRLVGRTSRGHTGGRSHRISHPPSFCGARLTNSKIIVATFFRDECRRSKQQTAINDTASPWLTLKGILGIFRLALLGFESNRVDRLTGEIEYDIFTSSSYACRGTFGK